MAHTNLLLGTNWPADEWPKSIDVMHEGAGDSLKYVPERTYMDINKAWSDFGENVFNDNILNDFDKFEKIYQICQEIAEPIKFTCEVETFDNGLDEDYDGSLYSYAPPTYYLSCGHEAYQCKPNYCPDCGAKVMN